LHYLWQEDYGKCHIGSPWDSSQFGAGYDDAKMAALEGRVLRYSRERKPRFPRLYRSFRLRLV